MKPSASKRLAPEQAACLRSLRDHLAGSDFSARGEWIAGIDRVLACGTTHVLGRIMRKPAAHFRYCAGHGAQKALIAATPPGGVLEAQSWPHAQSIRAVAKTLGRRAQVRSVKRGQPKRLVTLID